MEKGSIIFQPQNLAAYGELVVRNLGGSVVGRYALGPNVPPITILTEDNQEYTFTVYDADGKEVFAVLVKVQDGKIISISSDNLPLASTLFSEAARNPAGVAVTAEDASGNIASEIAFAGPAPIITEEPAPFEITVEEIVPFAISLSKIPNIFEVDITDSEAPEALSGLPFRITMGRAPVISVSFEELDPFAISLQGPHNPAGTLEDLIITLEEEGRGEEDLTFRFLKKSRSGAGIYRQ